MLPADDTSIFSVIQDVHTSEKKWSQRWKITLNIGLFTQVHEVISPRKIKKQNNLELFFQRKQAVQTTCQKHLGIFLGFKLSFTEHLIRLIIKLIKSIGFLREFQTSLTKKLLVSIYKSFIKPYLVHVDDTYDRR